MPQNILAGDDRATVKAKIDAILAYGGQSAAGNNDTTVATARLNEIAAGFDRPGLTDRMAGATALSRINALNGGPSWAGGADLYADFTTGQYWEAGFPSMGDRLNFTRSTSALMLGSAGYQSFAAGELARIDGVGAQVAPARTNKCTNRNANPVDLAAMTKTGDAAAVLSVVDDAAKLAEAGLSGISTSGKVYKLDNSGGVGPASAAANGSVGNLNTHAFSAYGRGGSGYLKDNFAGIPNTEVQGKFASSANYRRLTRIASATNAAALLQIGADAGQVVYFILNRLEEGSFSSPPIITTGAAATRAGDLLSADLTGKLTYGVAGFIKVDLRQPSVAGTFPRLLSINSGVSTDEMRLLHQSGRLRFEVVSGGAIHSGHDLGPWQEGFQTIAIAATVGFSMARRVSSAAPAALAPASIPSVNTLGIGGYGFNTNGNTFQINQKLALFYGSPSKPINQAFFDEVYAKAVAA